MREQDGVLAAYENWAPTYDTMPNPTRDLDAQVLRKVLRGRLGGCALELGCGTGKNTLWLAEQVDRLIAVDFSAAMLQRAKQRVGREVEFHVGDIRNEWPAASASLNAVVGNLVLEHIEDLGSVYSEAARVLRDDGWFFLSELHPFRQYGGSGARYSTDAGEIRVPVYTHHIAEYIGAGLQRGFELVECGEWFTTADKHEDKAPRLLTLLWRKK